MIIEIYKKYKFDINSDRLGPDLPFTSWRLLFKSKMIKLCKSKFKKFGCNSEFRPGAFAIACSRISIGDNVIIRPTTMLFADPRSNGAEIDIQDNALIGSGVHIYVNNHNFSDNTIPIFQQGHTNGESVIIKKNVWIGANAIILPGVIIGENSVIAAGSVVTKSVPSHALYGGVPAKLIRHLK